MRLRHHHRHEGRHPGQVDQHEGAGCHIAQVSIGPAGQAPGNHGDECDGQRGECGPRTLPVGEREYQHAAHGDRDQRDPDLPGGQRAAELPHGRTDDHRDENEERDLDRHQRDDDQGAQAESDRDGDGEIAARVDRLPLGHAARPPLSRPAVDAITHAPTGSF
jgi:hypothetical protein